MSLRFLALAAYTATLVVAQSSAPAFVPTPAKGHFVEQFLSDWADRWSPSRATKEDKTGEVFSYIGQWAVEEPTVLPGIPGDMGLVIKSKAAHHAISAPFDSPLDNTGKTLVVQYEVKLQKGLDCGGAYLKLLTDSDIGIQAEEFSDKTPYTIMFGPDRCGSTAKTHFIFRHKSPLTGEVEEKHLTAPPAPKTTKTTNLYTLIVRPDQTYEIKINDESVKTGSLLTDFTPSVNPPTEIDDPTDVKPADWVESPKISDPDAVKPADWDEDASETIVDESAVKPDGWLEDEEATIPDPDAEKPEEWSDEDDGDWIAPAVPNPKCEEAPGCGPWNRPQIANPAYKGKWFAPLIDNPEYKGVWAPKKIANPDYFNDSTPADFNKMAAVGFEIWSMTEDILFDNIYIGDSEAEATAFAAATFHVKKALEDALEAATTPAEAEAALGEEPDYKTDPVGYAKIKLQEFINIAVEDPVAAFKTKPYTGAATSVAFATLVGMLGVLFSLLIPGPKVKVNKKAAVAKKTDAVTADDSTAAAEEVKDAPIAGEEKSEETTRVTRAAKGKAAQ